MLKNKEYIFNGWNDKAVLLFHGATSGSALLRPFANYLNCNGYTVYGVNLAGHGTTKEDLAKITYRDIIDKAEADYVKIKSDFNKVYVAGISLGGLTTAYLASNHPEIPAFVTFAAGMLLSGDVPKGMGESFDSDYVFRTMADKKGMYKQYHVHYEYIPLNFYAKLGQMSANFVDNRLAEKITSPALIIHTKDDSMVPYESSQYLYDNIRSKEKELMLMDEGEHLFVLNEFRYEPFEKALALFDAH